MPCKNDWPRRPDPNEPVQVSCSLDSGVDTTVLFLATAQDLLRVLEETRHIGDSSHPNRLELEAQRAILAHAIRHHVEFRLHDDHWGKTSYAFVVLFEDGKASMESCGTPYQFSDLTKEDWRVGSDPLASHGGFLYRNALGNVIFKMFTWIS